MTNTTIPTIVFLALMGLALFILFWEIFKFFIVDMYDLRILKSPNHSCSIPAIRKGYNRKRFECAGYDSVGYAIVEARSDFYVLPRFFRNAIINDFLHSNGITCVNFNSKDS